MLTATLLLIAQPGIAAPAPPQSPRCPSDRMGFAPPLDTPLTLTRRIERELAQGTFTQTVTYTVSFTRSGRGYAMRWEQTGQHSDGPTELLRLLSLEGESAAGEVLDFTLDSDGALLGVSESPDSSQRLARAIARLRGDPALMTRPAHERATITAMLDRLSGLPPSERAAVHRARASRLLMLAGVPCRSGQVLATDGSVFQIVARTNESLVFQSLPPGPGAEAKLATSITATQSLASGLVESQDRRTLARAGGTARLSRESITLRRTE